MKKNVIFFVIVFIIIGVSVNAQIIDLFSFELKPEVSIPTFGSEELFNMGGGASLAMRLSILPFLAPFAEVRYTIHPTILEKSLTLLSTGLGIGLELFPFSIPRLGFGADLSAGYYMATWEDLSAGDFFFRGAVDVTYRFSSTLSLSLGGSYNHYLSVNDPLYQGIGVFLSGSINLGGLRGGTKIKTDSIELQPIFPIFHAFYDKNTVGTFNLTNQEAGDIQDVRVSFFVKQYMDQPKLSALYPSLGRGKSVEVPLYALFTEDVLRLTESTKVSAEIIIEYSFLGSPHQERISNTLHLHHRNAMIWDDDRKAASFVSAKDPAVLRFSKYTAGLIRQEGNSSINQNLRFAMGLFEGLRLYGLNYVIDPTTPYKELSANKAALDYLQFPYQTLVYKGGDCDDLSIMYAAVLESVGIKTAFITIPGHIYMAFDLDMEEEEALQTFMNPEELIIRDGRAWMPVEITLLNEGFMKAWLVGSKQWQDNVKNDTAAFLELDQAWDLYEPVGIPGEDTRITLPETDNLLGAYNASLSRFINREITPRVEILKKEISGSGNNPRLVNKLGVLYARFGMYGKARVQFEQAARRNYALSLSNLGNIEYLEKNYKEALAYYMKALDRRPKDKTALLGIARAQYELENYPEADSTYAVVQNLYPKLAESYTYLTSVSDGLARASSAATRRTGGAEWNEE